MNALALIEQAPAVRTYGHLSLCDGGWRIEGIPPHISMRLKQIFPRIARTAVPPFTLTDSDAVCADLIWFMARYPLTISPADLAHLRAQKTLFEDSRAAFERIMLPDFKPSASVGFREGMQPYPYQAQAIEIAKLRKRLLLLDDVGLGKTISALGVLCDPAFRPAAIVVEPHLAEQWLEEYVETFTTLRAHIITKTKPYDLPWSDLYIFKYSNIFGWTDIANTGLFKAVVFDEIQSLRGGQGTSKGRAAKVFADRAELRLGLTATPIYNYGAEIFEVIQFIEPGALGKPFEFTVEWCGNQGAVKDPKALGTYLRSGAGLDGLQLRCSTVVFGELDWSPQVHKQVIGRLRRPGQTRQVDAIYLHSDFGSDPLMIEVLGVKASQARNIVDPLAGAEVVFSDESRIQALAKSYLEGKAA